MNRRERILLIVGSSMIILLLFYYYIYSPRQREYEALKTQLAEREATLQRMEADVRLAPQLEAEFARLQTEIARLESKLPTEKETAVLLVQLQSLTEDLSINLTAIRPGPLESGATQPPVQTGQSSQPGQQPVQPVGAYMRYPIQLNMTASYAELLRLFSRLRDFPRLIVVRKLIVSPRDVPDLNTSLTVETFVLPKEARK